MKLSQQLEFLDNLVTSIIALQYPVGMLISDELNGIFTSQSPHK